MFRNLIFLGMLLAAASMAGWFTINRQGDQTTIQINRAEIRSDASRAISRGRELLEEREQRLAEQQQADLNQQANPYAGEPYPQPTAGAGDYRPQPYPGGPYGANPYPASQYPAGQYPTGQYPAGQYPASQYPASQYPASQYPGAPARSSSPSPSNPYPVTQYPSAPFPATRSYPDASPYQGGNQPGNPGAAVEARGAVRYGVPYPAERTR